MFLTDMENSLMSLEMRRIINCKEFNELSSQRTVVCLAAADMAGSRLSKV